VSGVELTRPCLLARQRKGALVHGPTLGAFVLEVTRRHVGDRVLGRDLDRVHLGVSLLLDSLHLAPRLLLEARDGVGKRHGAQLL
jgi:hypothetical protein